MFRPTLSAVVLTCGFSVAAAQEPAKVDFARDVQPLLKAHCHTCHGPKEQKNGLRLDRRRDAMRGGTVPVIAPGNSGASALYLVLGGFRGLQMPPDGTMSADEIKVIKAWIDQGAVWPEGPIQEFVKPVTFEADMKPLFTSACGACHTGSAAKGSFAIDDAAAVIKGGANYPKVVVPGDPKKSSLLTIIAGKDEDLPAPEKHKLAPKQIELVEQWIRQGAK